MLNWHNIMQSWDEQQTAYLPFREARFAVMLDTLETVLGTAFTFLDLACGPASLSVRILERFPLARCIAGDLDPVLMEIGKHVLADNARVNWLDIDLNQPTWGVNGSQPLAWLKEQPIDAIVTTTALHWLPPESLMRVYLQLGDLLKPGGVVMNGDHMMFQPHMTTFRQLSESIKAKQYHRAFKVQEQANYADWWGAFEGQLRQADSEKYGEMFAERQRRFASRRRDYSEPIRVTHEAALLNAGFVEVGSIWQYFDDCVLLGVRGPDQEPISN